MANWELLYVSTILLHILCVFSAFTNPITKWDENLKHTNTNYDIVEVYDGSKLENPMDGFKKRKVGELEVLYAE